jgi:hypothetical protein
LLGALYRAKNVPSGIPEPETTPFPLVRWKEDLMGKEKDVKKESKKKPKKSLMEKRAEKKAKKE